MTKARFHNVVVLMLENRSFDHLFGYLDLGDGLTGRHDANYLHPGDHASLKLTVRRGGDYTSIGQGPSHSLKSVNEQLFGRTAVPVDEDAASATMSGFVASFHDALKADLRRAPTESELHQVMNCFDPVQLPVLSMLARSFVLCDRWFADVPGPTMPNRAFIHAATSQGYTWNAGWKPDFTCQTLYDRINATHGKSWRIYYHDLNEVLELYPNVQKNARNNVLYESFLADAAGDALASYSFITPAFLGTPEEPTNSMHAPADVRPAEKLVADTYMALRSNPEVWKKTLLIIVFDEHGGYYDHVAPPATVSPDGIPGRTDQPFLVPFGFNRLGLRVPALLISPWLAPGVDSTVYSHATIPGTIIEAFKLHGGFLTKRDAAANRLTHTYLHNDALVFRDDTPELASSPQPAPLDAIQREVLNGTVHLDPHPEKRNVLRTNDIQDARQAKTFMRTQVSKHLEHYLAARSNPKQGPGSQVSAPNQIATPALSPSRVTELARGLADQGAGE
jgi:phospholipase C